MAKEEKETTRIFHITILGRMLEHLGVQMYKRRDIAIAELVANSWDAGASKVHITIPDEKDYVKESSQIIITDDGDGMSENQIEHEYLVVGRNRRTTESEDVPKRPVMGRKGIGKLAGFGIASNMKVITWKNESSTRISLNINELKTEAGEVNEVPIQGFIGPLPEGVDSHSGTKIILEELKHKSAIRIKRLHESLSRRFSRRVHGEMDIYINGEKIRYPALELDERVPEEGLKEVFLPSGTKIRYFYGFASKNITTKEMQGFTIYIRGKTAQAPPYFFDVESTASGLHYARYMTGAIEADFLDGGDEDESDLISTDRQEIDWAHDLTKEFLDWGKALTRKALREKAKSRGEKFEFDVLEIDDFRNRINKMDPPSQRQLGLFLRQIGKSDPDPDRYHDLADSLIRAFEYKHFHNMVEQIASVSKYPEQLSTLLTYLSEWKVLESRAILEIIQGRIEVIEKFHSMIVNNAPEIASSKSPDNMHDLIAGYPWLLNPEWQVLSEEKLISTQLREWNAEDIPEKTKRLRYDFIALGDTKRLIVIDIKRSNHPVELDELHRLETYKEKLSNARDEDLSMVMICNGRFNISDSTRQAWEERDDGEIRTWAEIYKKTNSFYQHYRAILKGEVDHEDFSRKEKEIAQTRDVLQPGGIHRNTKKRKQGLGPQDRKDDIP